jgi:hypothetical protein
MDWLLDEWQRKIPRSMPETNLGHPSRNRSLQKAEVERQQHLLWPDSSWSPVTLAILLLQQGACRILTTQAQTVGR